MEGNRMNSPLADIAAMLARRGEYTQQGDHLRVSGLEQCARRISLLRHHPPSNPTTWQAFYNMMQGDVFEKFMREQLTELGYTIRDDQRELQWPKDVPREDAILIGHIDGIIDHPTWPKEMLWENKFLGSFGLKKIERDSLYDGNLSYYTQSQLYMYMLREEGEDIDAVCFNAEVKESGALNRGYNDPRDHRYIDPLYESFIPYDEAHVMKSLARAARLYTRLKAGEILEHERRPGDWDCQDLYCPVYDICQPELVFGPAPKGRRK